MFAEFSSFFRGDMIGADGVSDNTVTRSSPIKNIWASAKVTEWPTECSSRVEDDAPLLDIPPVTDSADIFSGAPLPPASSLPTPKLEKHVVFEMYKTKMCRNWTTHGDCPYGVKCQFAHGSTELRERKGVASQQRDYDTQVQVAGCRLYRSTGGLGQPRPNGLAPYMLPSHFPASAVNFPSGRVNGGALGVPVPFHSFSEISRQLQLERMAKSWGRPQSAHQHTDEECSCSEPASAQHEQPNTPE